MIRTRWAAVGAAVAITLGGGGIGLVNATISSGERSVFVPITPCRLFDTRPDSQVGPRATPLGAAETHTVTAHGTNGDCTIPTDAVGLSMNVTAVGATAPTFLTFWATGETMPEASSLNPAPGQPATPNAVVTELSSSGQLDVFNKQGDVHVLADVNGYYADHDHDDRYVRARDGYVRLTSYEMRPQEQGTNWATDFGWKHTPATLTPECIDGRIELPVGDDVTAMNIVYNAPADVGVTVVLSAKKATSGSTITGIPPLAVFNGTAPATSGFELADLAIPVASPATVLDDYNYAASICTQGEIEIVGADVSVD
jgi:hypothetical protein